MIWTAKHIFSSEAQAFNQFWSPIFDNPHPTLIYVGGNAVYELSASYMDGYYKQHPRSQTRRWESNHLSH